MLRAGTWTSLCQPVSACWWIQQQLLSFRQHDLLVTFGRSKDTSCTHSCIGPTAFLGHVPVPGLADCIRPLSSWIFTSLQAVGKRDSSSSLCVLVFHCYKINDQKCSYSNNVHLSQSLQKESRHSPAGLSVQALWGHTKASWTMISLRDLIMEESPSKLARDWQNSFPSDRAQGPCWHSALRGYPQVPAIGSPFTSQLISTNQHRDNLPSLAKWPNQGHAIYLIGRTVLAAFVP